MTTTGNKSDYISDVRQAATKILDAAQALDALKKEWDYGMSVWLTDDDFGGENAGLTKADVTAVVGTTLAALDSLLAAGHGTNLAKIRL